MVLEVALLQLEDSGMDCCLTVSKMTVDEISALQ